MGHQEEQCLSPLRDHWDSAAAATKAGGSKRPQRARGAAGLRAAIVRALAHDLLEQKAHPRVQLLQGEEKAQNTDSTWSERGRNGASTFCRARLTAISNSEFAEITSL